MKRRRAPGRRPASVPRITAASRPAAAATSQPSRSAVRRERSARRGRTRRATACQSANGANANASATWNQSTGRPPTERRSPVLWATPATTTPTVSTPSVTEANRLSRCRRRPARTIRPFAGASTTTSAATAPCARTIHRPRALPVATAPTPVAKASVSATSRLRFVTRAGRGRREARSMSRSSLRGSPADRSGTSPGAEAGVRGQRERARSRPTRVHPPVARPPVMKNGTLGRWRRGSRARFGTASS